MLRVNARFSGRSALDVFGRCIGLGDSFEASITKSLRTQFKYRFLDDAKLILERKQDGTAYSQEVVRFHVPSVRVTSDAVVLTLDFALAVK